MRLIDADATNEKIDKINDTDYGSIFDYTAHREVRNVLRDVVHLIETAPTIEAEPVRHGMWKSHGNFIECSECGNDYPKYDWGGSVVSYYYCPQCGAKMYRGARDGEID